jgi:DNA-binding GntR family transcriptional regulator
MAQLWSIGIRISRGFGRIRLYHPDPTEESLLGLSPGTGAILFRRYLLNATDAVVEVGDAIVPGDREEIWLGVDFRTGQILQKPLVFGGPDT